MSSPRSRTTVESPRFLSRWSAYNPAKPAPTTTASWVDALLPASSILGYLCTLRTALLERGRDGADDALPEQEHAGHENEAINDHHREFAIGEKPVEPDDRCRAGDRPDHGADAADDGDDHDFGRGEIGGVIQRGDLEQQR